MRFAVMVEGQEDVGWDDWLALAGTCERLGFEALFRSDHYGSVEGVATRGSLDAWATLCGAGGGHVDRCGSARSSRPATFRHPSVLAKNAVTADHISGGRIEVGIGTGWHEREHRAYGFPFPSMKTRMDRLAEQLEVVTRLVAPGPFSFSGEHYEIDGLDARPKPVQSPLPLVMGGAAAPRGAALAARYAAEYNVVHATPEDAGAARGRIEAACRDAGRDPATMTFSLMHGLPLGADEADLRERGRAARGVAGEPVDGRAAAVLARGHAGRGDRAAARVRGGRRRAGDAAAPAAHDHAALELFAAEIVPAFA